jgi:hypothetical protein
MVLPVMHIPTTDTDYMLNSNKCGEPQSGADGRLIG